MVAGADHKTFSVVLVKEVDDGLHGSVVSKDLVDLSSRVVVVASMIDSAAFNHEEEALVAVFGGIAQGAQGSLCHFLERWVLVVDVSAVNLEGDVGGSKKTEQRELDSRAEIEGVKVLARLDVVPTVLVCLVNQVSTIGSAASSGCVGQEMAPSSTENQVDVSSQRAITNELFGDLVFHGTGSDVRGKACRGSVGDARRDDKAGGVAGSLCGLHDAAARRVVGGDADGAVVRLVAAAKGRGSSSTVGDETAAAAGAAVSNKVLVQDQSVVPRQGIDVLSPSSGQGQRGRAHAVADHEDEVSLSTRALAMPGRGWLGGLVLIHDSKNDDGGGSNEAPGEEGNLSPARPARGRS